MGKLESNRQKPVKFTWLGLIKFSAQLGVSAVRALFLELFIFGVVNLVLVILALVRYVGVGISWQNTLYVVLIVLLALGFIAVAIYLNYRLLLRRMLGEVYEKSSHIRIRMTKELVRRTAVAFDQDPSLNIQRLKDSLSWGQTLYRSYQKIPVFFQSGIVQYLKRIPVAGFLMELHGDIRRGDLDLAAEKLGDDIDAFFYENIVGSTSNKPAWVLLLIHIAVSLWLLYAIQPFHSV